METKDFKSMKTKIDITDFLILISWIKTFFIFEGKKFNHEHLLEQVETYKFTNTSLDTTIHSIDELMIDAFKVYQKLNETEKEVFEMMGIINIPFISTDLMKNEINRYKNIFEYLMENYKYEDPETRGIQKGILSEKMKKYIEVEDYENAAKMRDLIKEC